MILHLPRVLTADQVRHFNEVLAKAAWVDGRVSAGEQAAQVKNNLQIPEDNREAAALGETIVRALAANPAFMSAASPAKLFPPMFNRYREGMAYGPHVDTSIRHSRLTGGRFRTDLSCTLFLSDPAAYDGGELVIEEDLASRRVKLPAGDAVLYPADSVHQVTPVTRGERWASFFWVQSTVADPTRRRLLYDLDQAAGAIRAGQGDGDPAVVALVGIYHRLARMWSQV
ncbi:MAG TPA: Fe2+-dependent dioxygenase [Caulobacteraceae bacterium]|jgi:PKHD-type hydroxylase